MQNEKVTIIEARITAMPKSFFDPIPEVHVKYSDNPEKEVMLFSYYPDEISFTSTDFLELTREEAVNLKFNKDRNYLKS